MYFKMSNLQMELIFLLWCGIFGRNYAMDLDQVTKLQASYGEYSPKNLILKKGEAITVPWEGNTEFIPTSSLDMNSCKGEKNTQ